MQRLSQFIPRARMMPGKYSLLPHPETLRLTFFDSIVRSFAAVQQFGPKLDANQEPRFLEQVKLFYNEAANLTGIDEQYLNLIKACQTVVRFNIPLRRDNGTLETITCYR